MTHSICTSDADEVVPHFQRLWRTLLVPDVDPNARLEQLFEHETAEFDLEYAFVSSIDQEHGTERFDVVYGSHERVKPGTTVPLTETYCRKTIEHPEGTLAISDAVAEGWADDPAYQTFELGSYLGTTVSVDGEVYGTLCFADHEARTEPFVNVEKALVEMHGQWVSYVLALSEEPPIRTTRIDAIEGRTVSREGIDSMMDALKNWTRRSVLMALLDATETSLDALEGRVIDETERIQLHHSHLPRLANAGYVAWDADAGTVARGPRFSEVEPLVRLLREYERPNAD